MVRSKTSNAIDDRMQSDVQDQEADVPVQKRSRREPKIKAVEASPDTLDTQPDADDVLGDTTSSKKRSKGARKIKQDTLVAKNAANSANTNLKVETSAALPVPDVCIDPLVQTEPADMPNKRKRRPKRSSTAEADELDEDNTTAESSPKARKPAGRKAKKEDVKSEMMENTPKTSKGKKSTKQGDDAEAETQDNADATPKTPKPRKPNRKREDVTLKFPMTTAYTELLTRSRSEPPTSRPLTSSPSIKEVVQEGADPQISITHSASSVDPHSAASGILSTVPASLLQTPQTFSTAADPNNLITPDFGVPLTMDGLTPSSGLLNEFGMPLISATPPISAAPITAVPVSAAEQSTTTATTAEVASTTASLAPAETLTTKADLLKMPPLIDRKRRRGKKHQGFDAIAEVVAAAAGANAGESTNADASAGAMEPTAAGESAGSKTKRRRKKATETDEPVSQEVIMPIVPPPPPVRLGPLVKGPCAPIQLGLCCMVKRLRNHLPTVFPSRGIPLKVVEKDGMTEIKLRSLANLDDLERILVWCHQRDIHVLRLSSNMFPHASNPQLLGRGISQAEWDEYASLDFAKSHLERCGTFARTHQIRITMHPGQFNQVGAPNEKTLQSTIDELSHHCRILDLMGMDQDSVMVVHGGGMYGSKEDTLTRWVTGFQRLPDNVQKRLVVENDEKCYSTEDLLPLCKEVGMPLVFDTHHYSCYAHYHPDEEQRPAEELIPEVLETWRPRGIKPKFHVSEQDPNKVVGSHSGFIENLPPFLLEIPEKYGVKIDIMIEAKHKEDAIFKLYQKYPAIFPLVDPEDAAAITEDCAIPEECDCA